MCVGFTSRGAHSSVHGWYICVRKNEIRSSDTSLSVGKRNDIWRNFRMRRFFLECSTETFGARGDGATVKWQLDINNGIISMPLSQVQFGGQTA